jgi:protein-S-isoprenylcysteine O-methyltransferase Ste14
MPFISNIGAPASIPYLTVEYAWAITGLYFVATWLFTKSIKRRERISQRGPDLIMFFAGFILLFWRNRLPGVSSLQFLTPPPSLQIVGATVTVLGLGLTIWARTTLGSHFSGGVALKADHKLVQAGPYRRMRHPIYSGLILEGIGMVLCAATWSSLLGALLIVITFELHTRREDLFLASEFGPAFHAYRGNTGRLFPRI